MIGLGEDDLALVAREAAALRRHGWPASRVAEVLASRLPTGGTRARLETLATQLARGEKGGFSDDPLARLLALGDAAGPDALLEVAGSLELQAEAARAARAALIYPTVLVAFLALLLTLGGYLASTYEGMYSLFRSQLPAATELALQLGAVLRWLGPLLGVAALVAAAGRRGPFRDMPGLRQLRAASGLRLYAAARGAQLPEAQALKVMGAETAPGLADWTELDAMERHAARALLRSAPVGLGRTTDAEAARALASELELEGREALAYFRVLVPVAVTVVALVGAGLFVMAMYLPIFSIAGGIK